MLADFKGTQLGYLKLLLPFIELTPAGYQQATSINPSNYLIAMRNNSGDSSIVPTTSIWSQQDQIIFPNGPDSSASEWMSDNLGNGAANFEVISECRKFFGFSTPQGYGPKYGHIELLTHPLTYALIKDALTHDGPADISRIANRQTLCTQDSPIDTRMPPAATTAASSLYSLAKCLGSSSIFATAVAEPSVKAYATASAR